MRNDEWLGPGSEAGDHEGGKLMQIVLGAITGFGIAAAVFLIVALLHRGMEIEDHSQDQRTRVDQRMYDRISASKWHQEQTR